MRLLLLVVVIHAYIPIKCFRICPLEIKFQHINGHFIIFLFFIFNFLFLDFEKHAFDNYFLFSISHFLEIFLKLYRSFIIKKNLLF